MLLSSPLTLITLLHALSTLSAQLEDGAVSAFAQQHVLRLVDLRGKIAAATCIMSAAVSSPAQTSTLLLVAAQSVADLRLGGWRS